MNKLDKDYLALCQDILDNGTKKQTRTGTDSISIFGRQIRHKMSDGFPLLTTKKMAWKQIVTELLWFLRGDTNIKFLHDNNCHIWDGDYEKSGRTDGDLGPIYPKQWRSWGYDSDKWREDYSKLQYGSKEEIEHLGKKGIDQIANLIRDLKTKPDSRRLMISAWNVGELDQMVLPPCHYGFQVYTRELTYEERIKLFEEKTNRSMTYTLSVRETLDSSNIPTRAISLMWNQRSVDVPLGLPFNIASYGLLLHILAEVTNMIPDELIGNLGDCHIYENQIDGIKEQMGRELSSQERKNIYNNSSFEKDMFPTNENGWNNLFDEYNIPTKTREPYPLPKLNINTEFWPTESGESGVGPLVDNMDWLIRGMEITDFQVENYQSHPAIKIPLSN